MFFNEFCEISKNTFFAKHLWATASEFEVDRSNVLIAFDLQMFFFSLLLNLNLREVCFSPYLSIYTVFAKLNSILSMTGNQLRDITLCSVV